jgi:hypothetical protein
VSLNQRNARSAPRRRPVRSAEPVLAAPTGPSFPRFASAMAEARAANAVHLTPHDEAPAYNVAPAVGCDGPPPRAAQWRAPPAPRRPFVGWLGIGGSVLLVSWLAVTMLTPPISAEIKQLIRPWLEGLQSRETAAPQPDRAPPTVAEPVTGPDVRSGAMPVLARAALGVADQPDAAPPAGVTVAPPEDQPTARSVPVPAFKPRPPHR